MSRSRRTFTPQEKVSILRRHLLEQEAVSDICDELDINPNQFYRWQKEFFENGASAFKKSSKKAEDKRFQQEQDKNRKLEEKLQKKNEVVAELMEAHIELKKSLGEI